MTVSLFLITAFWLVLVAAVESLPSGRQSTEAAVFALGAISVGDVVVNQPTPGLAGMIPMVAGFFPVFSYSTLVFVVGYILAKLRSWLHFRQRGPHYLEYEDESNVELLPTSVADIRPEFKDFPVLPPVVPSPQHRPSRAVDLALDRLNQSKSHNRSQSSSLPRSFGKLYSPPRPLSPHFRSTPSSPSLLFENGVHPRRPFANREMTSDLGVSSDTLFGIQRSVSNRSEDITELYLKLKAASPPHSPPVSHSSEQDITLVNTETDLIDFSPKHRAFILGEFGGLVASPAQVSVETPKREEEPQDMTRWDDDEEVGWDVQVVSPSVAAAPLSPLSPLELRPSFMRDEAMQHWRSATVDSPEAVDEPKTPPMLTVEEPSSDEEDSDDSASTHSREPSEVGYTSDPFADPSTPDIMASRSPAVAFVPLADDPFEDPPLADLEIPFSPVFPPTVAELEAHGDIDLTPQHEVDELVGPSVVLDPSPSSLDPSFDTRVETMPLLDEAGQPASPHPILAIDTAMDKVYGISMDKEYTQPESSVAPEHSALPSPAEDDIPLPDVDDTHDPNETDPKDEASSSEAAMLPLPKDDPDMLAVEDGIAAESVQTPTPPDSPVLAPARSLKARPAWSVRAADAPPLGLSSSGSSNAMSASPSESTKPSTTPLPPSRVSTPVETASPELPASPKPKSPEILLSSALPGSFPEDDDPPMAPLVTEQSVDKSDPQARARPSRSPIDIALAMQLRPGLGLGADPAWMVRFLMSMFGWMALMISGTGGGDGYHVPTR
ncbi:hypothetical protein CYLTODRAFT_488531 [Cylindrobasidium torrendii FP15055 ss-10]|uniref:Uncharacterized protein n=1 Tax=Cylindrobasidium torrendii FP15055 ss-10 TaxID=1314674 RepID=A0A0D7BK00_9AGAR|nr:hypothetical protein CYLTODRAFT_488531 [Cylindrobasidium torrendii FP15055 ss-10]